MIFSIRYYGCIVLALWNVWALAATRRPDPYELAQYAELGYKALRPGPLDGQEEKPRYVSVEGVDIHQVFSYGNAGTTIEDYLNPEHTGFHAYTMEKDGQIFLAMRGTQNPLHALLDIHIMIEGASADLSGILAGYFGGSKSTIDAFLFGTKLLPGLFQTATTTASSKASEGWGSIVTSALSEALPASLPPDLLGFYTLCTQGKTEDLQKAVHARFKNALGQAENCLKAVFALAGGRPVHVIGHSLGGTLATISVARSIVSQGIAPAQIDVTTFCSPGSRVLLGELTVPEGLSIINYGRSKDVIHMFGAHIGINERLLDTISPEAHGRLHAFRGTTAVVAPERYWFNPLKLFDVAKGAMATVHSNHSIAGVIFDLEAARSSGEGTVASGV